MAFLRKRRDEPKVDLTPMVDVVFLLLIFFMISTTFIETPGLTIKLPESTSQVVEKAPEELKVYLSKQGEIYLGEKAMDSGMLRRHLASLGSKTVQMTFLLMADKEARHGQVVELMDMAKVAGFGKLAIATEQRTKP